MVTGIISHQKRNGEHNTLPCRTREKKKKDSRSSTFGQAFSRSKKVAIKKKEKRNRIVAGPGKEREKKKRFFRSVFRRGLLFQLPHQRRGKGRGRSLQDFPAEERGGSVTETGKGCDWLGISPPAGRKKRGEKRVSETDACPQPCN